MTGTPSVPSATPMPSFAELRRRLYLTLAVYALWFIAYELVGTLAARLRAHDLSLPLDHGLPFLPQWIFVYQLTYLLPLLAVFLADRQHFRRGVIAIVVAALLAFPVYLLLPVSFASPSPPADGLSGRLLTLEHGLGSARTNMLPSLHVANAWLIYLAVRRQRLGRAGDSLLLALVVAISLSTLLVKQHLLLDVVTGLLLAPCAWAIAKRLSTRA